MRSETTKRFRKAYAHLPEHIQEQTRKAYKLWRINNNHPGLQFKQVHDTGPIYSVRISLSYLAIGLKEKDTIIWIWVGTHAEYDKMIASLYIPDEYNLTVKCNFTPRKIQRITK